MQMRAESSRPAPQCSGAIECEMAPSPAGASLLSASSRCTTTIGADTTAGPLASPRPTVTLTVISGAVISSTAADVLGTGRRSGHMWGGRLAAEAASAGPAGHEARLRGLGLPLARCLIMRHRLAIILASVGRLRDPQAQQARLQPPATTHAYALGRHIDQLVGPTHLQPPRPTPANRSADPIAIRG